MNFLNPSNPAFTENVAMLVMLWGLPGLIVYMSTFQQLNSKLKRPIWAIICGPITTFGTIVYWFFWTIHFIFFKEKRENYYSGY